MDGLGKIGKVWIMKKKIKMKYKLKNLGDLKKYVGEGVK